MDNDERVAKMDADQFYTSKGGKYLKGDDIEGQEWELTIKDVERGGADDFYPLYLHFHEIEQMAGLNKGNYVMVKENMGSANTDEWIGKKIVLYGTRDSNKDGKMVNVFRVRPPAREVKRVVPTKARQVESENPAHGMDDEVPFEFQWK